MKAFEDLVGQPQRRAGLEVLEPKHGGVRDSEAAGEIHQGSIAPHGAQEASEGQFRFRWHARQFAANSTPDVEYLLKR
jgi:hypothetical protein